MGTSVGFYLRADSYNDGDLGTVQSVITSDAVAIGSSGNLYKAEISLDATRIPKELWRFRFNRQPSTLPESYPGSILILSASLTYPSAH